MRQQLSERFARARARSPFLDHLVRTIRHYGEVKGSRQAGAITYFAFLSFFPILALGFAVVGFLARIYPDAEEDLITAINHVLPGMVGDEPGQISLASIEAAAGTVVGLGLLGVLYAGLGWLSAMRDALLVMFETPAGARPGFVTGKLRDLIALVLLGVVLLVSVAISGLVTSFSTEILDWLGLSEGLSLLLGLLSVVIALAANALLFFAFFRLLAAPDTPRRSLWSGALLGAIGFEALKLLSTFLLRATSESEAFQAFGIALILVVWMYYVSQVALYAAAWAHMSPAARARREVTEVPAPVAGPAVGPAVAAAEVPARAPAGSSLGSRVGTFGAGAISALGLLAWLRRRR